MMPNGQKGYPCHHRNSKHEHDQTTTTPGVWVVTTDLSQEPRLAPISRCRSIRDSPGVKRERTSSEGIDQQEDDQSGCWVHVCRWFAFGIAWLSTLRSDELLAKRRFGVD